MIFPSEWPTTSGCQQVICVATALLAEWNRAWTDPDDPDRLLYYVPRLVSRVELAARDSDDRDRALCRSLSERFGNYEQVADLVGNPAVLAMVRGLAEDNDLEPFERRGDLYHQTSHAMLRRAAKGGEAAYAIAIDRIETITNRKEADHERHEIHENRRLKGRRHSRSSAQ
jgi:hypothetical protein